MVWREAIKDHLRRMWKVYLAGIVALMLANHLVYTLTRPSYGEDETLKIMLLNVEVELDEAQLLEKTRSLGFEAVELVPLAIALEDPASEMLLKVQLVGGYGDIYITDAQGLAALEAREVCQSVHEAENGMYLVVIGNGTNLQSAIAAMDILEKEMGDD